MILDDSKSRNNASPLGTTIAIWYLFIAWLFSLGVFPQLCFQHPKDRAHLRSWFLIIVAHHSHFNQYQETFIKH